MEAGSFVRVLLVAFLNHCSAINQDLSACLDARNHKKEPGPESSLYGHCTPWKDRACCTEQTTHDVHHKDMYSMSLDFCKDQVGRGMSDRCREYFHKDLCFYECEPNIGPWVVQVNRKIGKERFYEVPLCSSDCAAWWEACKDDYACTPNWPRGFVFRSGKNYCPTGSKCVTFKEMYADPADFCSKVWDHSWKVVPDNTPCIRMWFNASGGNPNRKVAEYYRDRIDTEKNPDGAGGSAAPSSQLPVLLTSLTALAAAVYSLARLPSRS